MELNWNKIKQLLIDKDFEALTKLEPSLFKAMNYRLKEALKSQYTPQGFIALTYYLLENRIQNEPTSLIYPYQFLLLQQFMKNHRLIKIDSLRQLKAGDATLYFPKDNKDIKVEPVDILDVVDKSACILKSPYRNKSFGYTFTQNEFRYAIRQLPPPRIKLANPKFKFFFFNS